MRVYKFIWYSVRSFTANLSTLNEPQLKCRKQPEKLQNESQRFPFSTTARRSKQRKGIAARPSIAMDKNRYNQVPQFVGLETPAFRAPQTPCHASTRPHASTQVHFVCYEFLQVWRRRADGYRTSRDYPMIGVLEQINQVPRFVGLETVAFRAPQNPCHAITMPQMMQIMHLAFLASPPLKNHLQHNLKKPSLEAPSSPSMCRVYVYLSRATPPNPLTTHFVRQTQLR